VLDCPVEPGNDSDWLNAIVTRSRDVHGCADLLSVANQVVRFGSTSFVRFGVVETLPAGSGGRPGTVCGQTWAGRGAPAFWSVSLFDRRTVFFVPTCPGPVTPRAAAVKDGRRCDRTAGAGAARQARPGQARPHLRPETGKISARTSFSLRLGPLGFDSSQWQYLVLLISH